jgi:hypothetical protein
MSKDFIYQSRGDELIIRKFLRVGIETDENKKNT